MAKFRWGQKVSARLLSRPILQEYDAFTVDEPAMHPAESGKLAARHNLVGIAEACRKEEDAGIMDERAVDGAYQSIESSNELPGVQAALINGVLADRLTTGETKLIKGFRRLIAET